MRKGYFLGIAALFLAVGIKGARAQDEMQAEVPTPVATVAGEVITTEGIAGEYDRRNRGPVVLVRTEPGEGFHKLIVDSYVPNDEFKKYPLKFDFYVNNQFFTSQVRSTELPGPLGVTVGSEVAQAPFNYTIVATTLHPNRTFTSVVYGAVFASDLIATLDCTLSEMTATDSDGGTSYTASSVTTGQSSNDSLTLSFEGSAIEGGALALVSSSVTVSEDSSANGTLTVTKEGVPSEAQVSGTVLKGESGLESVELATEDGLTTLSCS